MQTQTISEGKLQGVVVALKRKMESTGIIRKAGSEQPEYRRVDVTFGRRFELESVSA